MDELMNAEFKEAFDEFDKVSQGADRVGGVHVWDILNCIYNVLVDGVNVIRSKNVSVRYLYVVKQLGSATCLQLYKSMRQTLLFFLRERYINSYLFCV